MTTTQTEQPTVNVTQPDESSDIRELVNIPALVPAFGKTYQIKKFSFGQLCQSFEYVGPIVVLLQQLLSFPRDEQGKPNPTADQITSLAVTAISIAGPSVMGIVSIATQEPMQWLEEQEDAMGGLAVFAKAVEKNLDFFTPENIERFKALFAGLQAKIPRDVGK